MTIRRGGGLTLAYYIPGNDASRNPDWWNDLEITESNLSAIVNEVRVRADSTGYRIPTEAQWEFAAKGGSYQSPYSFSGGATLDEVAWYAGNSAEGHTFTHNAGRGTRAVGGKRANALGIHDMSGNVFEWVWDWAMDYDQDNFPSNNAPGEVVDPTGPLTATGNSRVFRGGSWDNQPSQIRLVNRGSMSPESSPAGFLVWGVGNNIGFRVARPAP